MYIYFMRNKDSLGKIIPTQQGFAVYLTERSSGRLTVTVENIVSGTKYNVAHFNEDRELFKYDEFMNDLAITLEARLIVGGR